MADPGLPPIPNEPKADHPGGSWFSTHKPIVIGGGVLILGLVAYLIYKSKKNASSTASTSPSNNTYSYTQVPLGTPTNSTGQYSDTVA